KNLYSNVKKKKENSGSTVCFAGGRAPEIRDRSQESHCLAESLLTVDLRDAESAESSLTAAEKVIVTPKHLKSEYFGFWSVDGKLVEPTAKVVYKLCKLELAYHSTTSNARLHLQNVPPSEYGIICGTSAKQDP